MATSRSPPPKRRRARPPRANPRDPPTASRNQKRTLAPPMGRPRGGSRQFR
jgi:hypothetical protein